MKTRIDFINIPRSDAFARSFETHLKTLERRFSGKRRDEAVSLHARFTGTAFSPEGSLREVQAEILVKIPHRKDVFVRSKGDDIQKVAMEVVANTESIIRREAQKKSSSRYTFGKGHNPVKKRWGFVSGL